MYPDTKRIRQHRIVLRLDEYEHALINALANYQGEALATIARHIIMREATETLVTAEMSSLAARNA